MEFKTGMCEMKILGSEVLWCVLGHWFKVDVYVGYNMEICSGKIQNRDMRDENLGV